jgi:type IV pilus assembly protein PilC
LFLWRFSQSENGKITVDKMRLKIPYLGDLYKKLFLSRIADNLDTMLSSGISMVKAVEITSNVVGSHVYRSLLEESIKVIRGGGSLSEALSTYDEVPLIMIQMLKIGEETGKLGFIFGTVSRFYKQEVEAAIETMVALIEPVLIIVLGVGVGVLLTSVLLPIYNIAGTL